MNTWRMDIKDVIKEIEKFGFRRVLDIPFENYDEKRTQEHLYVYFHDKTGIILQFDTHSGNRVNGGDYYYEWLPNGKPHHNPGFSSGGWRDIGDAYIWEGHSDCREGMFESIRELESDGTFITPWVKASGIFSPTFVHYMDHHPDGNVGWDASYELYRRALKEKTPERFYMLPSDVQEAIKNNMRFNR